MSSISSVLLQTMDELLEDDFERFKSYLSSMANGFERIPCGKLEKANQLRVLKLMTDQYGESEAVKITVWVLNQIKKKPLANELEKKVDELKGGVSGGQVQAGDGSGVSSSFPQAAGVSQHISGASNVLAPVLSGGTYNGPVTINLTSTAK